MAIYRLHRKTWEKGLPQLVTPDKKRKRPAQDDEESEDGDEDEFHGKNIDRILLNVRLLAVFDPSGKVGATMTRYFVFTSPRATPIGTKVCGVNGCLSSIPTSKTCSISLPTT